MSDIFVNIKLYIFPLHVNYTSKLKVAYIEQTQKTALELLICFARSCMGLPHKKTFFLTSRNFDRNITKMNRWALMSVQHQGSC